MSNADEVVAVSLMEPLQPRDEVCAAGRLVEASSDYPNYWWVDFNGSDGGTLIPNTSGPWSRYSLLHERVIREGEVSRKLKPLGVGDQTTLGKILSVTKDIKGVEWAVVQFEGRNHDPALMQLSRLIRVNS